MIRTLFAHHHDLVTPDGFIVKIRHIDQNNAVALVRIENISSVFVGFSLPLERLFFNFKSVLAQLGLNGIGSHITLDKKNGCAELQVELQAIGPLARTMLPLLTEGAYIGKLFAADERRHVHNPDYLVRMFDRFDREGRPLLSFGGANRKKDELLLEKVGDHLVAFLKLRKGRIEYAPTIEGFLPTLALALKTQISLRSLLRLHQKWQESGARITEPDKILLVCTPELHIRTCFARVVDSLLPPGFKHTTANILQPDTKASGDIYELYGEGSKEMTKLPLEFYTLEPYREHVFFSDRDQLQHLLDNPKMIFDAFATAPLPKEKPTAVFIVKGSQMMRLKPTDWIERDNIPPLMPADVAHHADIIEEYIQKNIPSAPFLQAIEQGIITSQGVLFTRYFPSPLLKRKLLSYNVQRALKALYFQIPSRTNGYYFSHQDRSLLMDLYAYGFPVYWADELSGQILQYIQRAHKSSGLFVPLDRIETFRHATFFGVYGSNLIAGDFQKELEKLLADILELRNHTHHPQLNRNTPLALVTGGGPGAMEVSNKIAKDLHILSCAHVVDFRISRDHVVIEQKQNPYVEAKMSYRLDQLIERQANFYLDFPIFVMGGIGTDFEYSLEELRHKVGSVLHAPIMLFGKPEYWREKITHRFQCNMRSGTIKGSEWLSNCFFCIQNAEEGLKIYRDFFENRLKVGPEYGIFPDGFVIAEKFIKDPNYSRNHTSIG